MKLSIPTPQHNTKFHHTIGSSHRCADSLIYTIHKVEIFSNFSSPEKSEKETDVFHLETQWDRQMAEM